jgi:hypothetical protein
MPLSVGDKVGLYRRRFFLPVKVLSKLFMEETTQPPPDWIDIGAWVDRQQAFALIAKKCTPLGRCPSSK